jgi:hypothetical protein
VGAQGCRRLSGAGRGAPDSLTEDPTEGGWPRLLILLASPTQWGAPSFTFLAKGGYPDRRHNGFCAERTKSRRQHRYPPLQKTQGQDTLEPNFRPPFDRISDPQIPLTRLKKNGAVVDFRSPERLSDNRTTSYGS